MSIATVRRVDTETTNCVLCRGDRSRSLGEIRLGEELLGRVVQCRGCDLRYMSPRPTQGQRDWLYEREYGSELPGEHAQTRFESVHGDQDQGHVRFARYLDRLESVRRSTADPRLLDVGAGTGQLLEQARARGWDVYAIEQSQDARDHLADILGAGSVVGRDIADGRDTSERYHAIVMAHVIEHLPDPLSSLRAVRRMLAPGGSLLIATPNEGSFYERIWQVRQRVRGEGSANPYVAIRWHNGAWERVPSRDDEQGLVEFQILTTEHLYFFTPSTLGQLIDRAGFDDVRWAAGSVARANSRVGRLLRNDVVNRAASLVGLQSELVAVATTNGAMA